MAIRGRGRGNSQNNQVLKTRTPNSRNYNGRSSRGKVTRKKSPLQMALFTIIIIAFICGLTLGVSIIMGVTDTSGSSDDVQYVNVTKNITKYENGSNLIETEDGSVISVNEFQDNVTEGENITAFNASSSNNLY